MLKKEKIIDNIFESIQKKYKDNAYTFGKVPEIDPDDYYSFGSLMVNYQMTGNLFCGVKKGKIIEIYGKEGTFKSTLLYCLYADAQKKGFTVAHIDAERSVQPDLAKAVGVDLSKMLILEQKSGEEGLNMILDLIENVKSLKLGIIGCDSVDGLVPESILESDIGESEMGAQARIMWQGIRKIKLNLKPPLSVVFINQIKQKIGVVFGNPNYRRGGNSLNYYSWINIESKSSRTGAEETTDLSGVKNDTGVWLTLEAIKNKGFPPFRKAKVYAEYGKGFNKELDLINAGIFFGILKIKKEKKLELIIPGLTNEQYLKDILGEGKTKKKLKKEMENNQPMYDSILSFILNNMSRSVVINENEQNEEELEEIV